MAKEVSMIENNEKGRQARKYFIACEKKYMVLLKKEKLLLQYKNLKLNFDSFNYQDYDKTLNSIKAHINNLKRQLVYEKKSIELKISELDKTGLTDTIEAYVQPDGEIAVIQNL